MVVVDVVATVVGVVPVDRAPPVVVVVSSPRRYLPSSVPPQLAAGNAATAASAVAAVTRRSAKSPSPRNAHIAETSQLSDRVVRLQTGGTREDRPPEGLGSVAS